MMPYLASLFDTMAVYVDCIIQFSVLSATLLVRRKIETHKLLRQRKKVKKKLELERYRSKLA